jgi:hypothetical protein
VIGRWQVGNLPALMGTPGNSEAGMRPTTSRPYKFNDLKGNTVTFDSSEAYLEAASRKTGYQRHVWLIGHLASDVLNAKCLTIEAQRSLQVADRATRV